MDSEQEKHDVEFEAFLRQFRPHRPRMLRSTRGRAWTALAVAAAVIVIVGVSLRFASRAPVDTAAAVTNTDTTRTDVALQAAPSRAVTLIPFVEATLSASAPPAGRQPRVNISLPAEPRRKALSRVRPMYPPEAEEIGLEGDVVLKLTVNAAGDVTDTERISATVDLRADEPGGRERVEFYAMRPYALAQAADAAARQWKFEPAPSAMTVFVAFLFTLKSPEEAARGAAAGAGGPAWRPSRGLARPGPPPAAGSQSGPVRVGGAIRPPRRLVNVNPVYPEGAQAAGAQGVVIVQITVAEDGTVRDAQILRSIPELDQAALDAVLQWQYEPTLLNGVPVEVLMTVTVNFTLR